VIAIWINGERRENIASRYIAQLVEELQLPARALLIEHNGVALRPDEWPQTKLAANDRIELLRVVAGG